MEQSTKAKQRLEARKNSVRAGEFHRIHDKRTSGHKSLLTGVKKDGTVEHIPVTHTPITRRQHNIKLEENPQIGKIETAYIISKVQKTSIDKVGKKQADMQIKNATDKSVVRHLKNQNKKR